MSKELNISIIVDNDLIWSLPLWEKTIPILIKNKFSVKNIIVCNEKLAIHTGFNRIKWYFDTFGFFTFFKLSLFAIIILIKRQINFFIKKNNRNFYDLAKQYNCQILKCSSPNEKKIQKNLIISDIKIILLMSSHILNKGLVKIPSIGIINKHSSALPSNKGLFPFLWSVNNGTPQGISCHKVNSNIDDGRLLYQKLRIQKKFLSSMVSFYVYVYDTYPLYIIKAIKNLINKKYLKYDSKIRNSYYGLPKKEDYKTFVKKGGSIINIIDIVNCLLKKL